MLVVQAANTAALRLHSHPLASTGVQPQPLPFSGEALRRDEGICPLMKGEYEMTVSMCIPMGLLLLVTGGVLLATKRQPKIAAALLILGLLLIGATCAIIELATSM